MKVKIFADIDNEMLERRVNKWLKAHPTAAINQIMQTESGNDDGNWLTITICYTEGDSNVDNSNAG